MRRFEHPAGKFWSIDESHGQVTIRWGKVGTPGNRRDMGAQKHKVKELIDKQLAEGYVEVFDVKQIVSTIEEGVRWYRRLEGNGRMAAFAIDRRRIEEWRGPLGDSELPEAISHVYASFAEAKQTIEDMLAVAIDAGMKIISDQEPVVSLDGSATALEAESNGALERACRAAPDDPGVWAVYADWLMERHYLRGELAALRVRGKEAEAEAMLRASGAELFDGDTDLREAVELTAYRHGFACAATIKLTHGYDDEGNLDEHATAFLKLPVAMFVDELRFGLANFESNNDWSTTIKAVALSPHAEHVRALRFDAYNYDEQEISWTPFGDFSFAWASLPQLEELRLKSGAGGTLGTIVLPRLKKFVRVSGGLSAAEIESIANATWPELEHLEIWFGSANYGAEGDVSRIARILDGVGLPKLVHLGLVNCEFSDALIPALAQSKILPQLRTLDLSRGVMIRRSAQLLIDHAAAFRHLTAIDLRENLLAPDAVAALKATGLPLALDDQREWDGDDDESDADGEYDDRYCALGE